MFVRLGIISAFRVLRFLPATKNTNSNNTFRLNPPKETKKLERKPHKKENKIVPFPALILHHFNPS